MPDFDELYTWARYVVMWYWSADALFWQLPIDHNMDDHNYRAVGYDKLIFSSPGRVTLWLPSPSPTVYMRGRVGVRSLDNQRFAKFPYPWCSPDALRALELHYTLFLLIFART